MKKYSQEERDTNETNNIRVIGKFKDYWDARDVDLRQQSMGLMFKAQVNYQSPKIDAIEQTDVRISLSGYGTDGSIDIMESGKLVSKKFHLGMSAAFGTYKIDSQTGVLTILNTSDKMGGAYTVQILPLV